MRKRVLASMLSMVLAVSAAGCGSGSDSSESVESADEVMESDNKSTETGESEEEKSAEESKEESTVDTEADNVVTWSFDEETYTLTISGSGDMEDYASYYDTPWYDLEYGYVVVEDGVTSVGNYAFCYYYLRSAIIADSVTRIGDYAFYNCEYLSLLKIPDTCSIGRLAFYDCDLAVDEDGFLIINNTLIQYSGDEENVVVPDGVTTISYRAMGLSLDARGINSLYLPASVSSIDEQAFTGCEKMTAIYVDDNNPYYKSIDGVLYSKDGQTLIYCPAGYGESYVIPNGVTTIGAYAFEDSSLTELTISSDVSFIGKGAFYDSDKSMNIIAEEGGAYYVDADGVLFTADGTTLIRGGNVESYEIPDGVTSIEAYAFYHFPNLSSVAFPDTLISIGDYAFSDCYNLAEIVLPDSLTEIGDYTFYNCGLSSVTLSKSLTEIGEGTFMACGSLEEIIIPEGVTKIGASAFSNAGLIKVELPKTLEYIGAGAFSGPNGLTDVYYGGSEEEWLAVEIHPVGNSHLTESASVHFA